MKKAIYACLLNSIDTADNSWNCCGNIFISRDGIFKHLHTNHNKLIEDAIKVASKYPISHVKSSLYDINLLNLIDLEEEFDSFLQTHKKETDSFRSRRCDKGASDGWKLTCDCNNSGTVLLFYRYFEVSLFFNCYRPYLLY